MGKGVFRPVSSQVRFPELEERILRLWKERRVFPRTWEEREGRPLYVFYEGPPTANGRPHMGHVLTRVIKDVVLRYWTMKGYRVLRRGGWDTHGLPVELEVEKELGLTSKRQIEEYGIDRFNQRCRESVWRYVKDWEAMTERVGFWVDLENAYVTYRNEYIETCWWLLRNLWDRGLLYLGRKVAPHCPRCVTTLSSHEVALGYQENTPDPSAFVMFPVVEGPPSLENAFLLAWTTTPWTLPGNTALAVNPGADYALVEVEREGRTLRLVLACTLLDSALQAPYRIRETLKGEALRGVRYRPLYNPFRYGVPVLRFTGGEAPEPASLEDPDSLTYPVITADFVSLEDGTGIVHIAPAFGDVDYEAGRSEGLFFVQPVDLQGTITGAYPFAGRFVKEADPLILQDLKERGLLYRHDTYYHTYPFCWRCGAPLLYYAKASWYIRTTAVKEQLLRANDEIRWYPDYIKYGRFGEWLENNVDWALSRERYWGTPLPIWQCQRCGRYHCVGSIRELQERAAVPLESLGPMDLHRPWVDRVLLRCECGGEMSRLPEVIDVWFDSGAMPFAQFHYPFEAPDLLEEQDPRRRRFPADFITEAIDQTRGWFYALHAISTLITGRPCFRNVICMGLVLDEKGEKMSKSKGNVVEPGPILESQGADALRWYLYTSAPPWGDRRFSEGLVRESVRRFLLILWNVYNFFVTYANLEGFHPREAPNPGPATEMDRWLLSALQRLVEEVTREMDRYDPTTAARRLEAFVVEDLSTWYLRRSRRRFGREGGERERLSAYHTLYRALETLVRLLAPFIPFTAEEIYQNLVVGVDPSAPDSVHLAPWPIPDPALRDPDLERAMEVARRVVELGRSARNRARVKVRQPLPALLVRPRTADEAPALQRLAQEIADELNVKEVRLLEDEGEVVSYRLRPNLTRLGPRLGSDLERVRRALEEGGAEALARRVRAGFPVEVAGVHLEPEDLLVEMVERPGYTAVEEGGYLAAVDTRITPELRREGLARELIHRVQNLRRAAGLSLEDRIRLWVEGPSEVQEALAYLGEHIRRETLASSLEAGPPPEGAHRETVRLDGLEVTLALERAG